MIKRRLAEVIEHLGGDRVWISPIGEVPAQRLPRTDANEAVAAHPLALLGRFEQEGRLRRRCCAQLEEGRYRRLAVVDELVAQRDQRVVGR